ncbi:hypothetical protein VTO73DRAFT_4925 [Trametes versicolor]
MSTFARSTSSGLCPSISVRPRTVPVIPRRRKASELDDVEDESIHPAKRFKHFQINQRLSKISLTRTGKKRVRDKGKAVERRKRYIKSLRNIPAQPDNIGGAQYAFTFVLTSFAPCLDAMEDIEVSLPAMDIDFVSQTPAVSLQHRPVPMSIDGPQAVGSTELSPSISNLYTEMEIVSEHALALDAVAGSSGDEDQVMADTFQVAVPNVQNFISRFLARAAATAAAVPRQATKFKTTQPKGAIRGVGKTSSRKIHAAATPYARTGRRQALTTTTHSSRSRNAQDNLLHHLAATTSPVIVEDAVHDIALEFLEGSPAPVNEKDLEELLADTKGTSETQQIDVLCDAFEKLDHETARTSLPPSPVLTSPQLLSATSVSHNCDDDTCIASLLLTADIAQAPNSPPSLYHADSEDSSAYASEIDECYGVESVSYNAVADPAAWLLRDAPVPPDLEEEVAVVIPVEETAETKDIQVVADPCLGSLFAHLDKWSCEDSPCVLPTTSHADVLVSSGPDVMDDSVSPSASFGDAQMTYDASYTDFMDGIAHHTYYSAPPSPALPASGPMADIDYAFPSHPPTAISNYGIKTPPGSPVESPWTLSFFVPTSPCAAADSVVLGNVPYPNSSMDLDTTSASHNALASGLDYGTADTTSAQQPICPTRLSGGNSGLAMLEDAPSVDRMDFATSRVPSPAPAPVFPVVAHPSQHAPPAFHTTRKV